MHPQEPALVNPVVGTNVIANKVNSGSIFSDSEEEGKEPVTGAADSDSDDPFRENSPVSQVKKNKQFSLCFFFFLICLFFF